MSLSSSPRSEAWWAPTVSRVDQEPRRERRMSGRLLPYLVRQPEARLVLGPQQERADVLLEDHAHDVLLLEQAPHLQAPLGGVHEAAGPVRRQPEAAGS